VASVNGKSQRKPDTIETVQFVPLGELKGAMRQILSASTDPPLIASEKEAKPKQAPRDEKEKAAVEK